MSGYSHIDLDGLYRRVEEHEHTFQDTVSKLREQADCMLAAARKVGESWSGSCMGYHTALYFGNFEKPGNNRFNVEWGCSHGTPQGWHERQPDDVKQQIEELAQFQIDPLQDRGKQVARSAGDLRDDLTLELSPLDSLTGFTKEKELLRQIEKLDWGNTQENKYIADVVNACPRATRDFAAINEGRRIPFHTFYEAIAIQTALHADASEEFWRQSKRLLKRLQSMIPVTGGAREKVGEVKVEKVATQVTNVYNLQGTHSRVNIRSSDQSLNISNVTSEQLFLNLREHIEENVQDEADRKDLLERLAALEKTKEKASLLKRYQEFIAAAANHMTLIAPFVPALTQLLK
jgi:hypothetical protein